MLLGTLNAQVEVQYFDNPDRLFHLNKIDGIPYFGKNTNQLDFNISPNNSQIYIFNGINFELKLNLNYINDSLNNAYLFDLWQNDEKIIILLLSISMYPNKKYLTIMEYDNNFESFTKTKLFAVDNLRLPFGHQRLQIGKKTSWYLLEFSNSNMEGKGVVRVNYENGIVNLDRVLFDKGTIGLSLDDVFWDGDKEILILNTTNSLRKFLVFNTEFNLLYSGYQNSRFHGITYTNPKTIVLGGENGQYTILERFRYQNVFILLKRQLSLTDDSISVSEDYSFLFPEDHSFFLQKYQKKDFTILHYSKSSLDFSSDSYGYRIIYLDKNGEMKNQFEVHEESSIVLGILHFYDNNTIAYGNGDWLYPGFSEPIIIKLTLTDTTTSTEDIWQEATPSILLSNLIVDSKLRFIDNEIDLNRITVYDISGRQLISGLSADGDISFLPVGHYVLRYDSAKGVLTERFVKVE